MIRISQLRHKLGHTDILSEIDLELPKGKLTALIGPNGAGKSTLLSLIARLVPIQTGQITVDDLTLGTCPSDVLARRLAILPQSSDISLRLTVAELAAFGRYPHHKGSPRDEDRARVQAALDAFDLSAFAARPLESLSGGQRQRALLAMVMAQDTDYILLDEPLNNLDIAASTSLMRLLRQLVEVHGKTIVIVLHDINYASAYADHIVTLKEGRLGSSGPPMTVVSDTLLRDVFGTSATLETIGGRPFVAPICPEDQLQGRSPLPAH